MPPLLALAPDLCADSERSQGRARVRVIDGRDVLRGASGDELPAADAAFWAEVDQMVGGAPDVEEALGDAGVLKDQRRLDDASCEAV